MAGLLSLVLMIALVGVIVWFITTYLPMPPIFKTLIWIVCAIVICIFLINMIGGGVGFAGWHGFCK